MLCASLVLAFSATAFAQLKANSDEDKAYRKITAEKNPDTQLTMLQDFEKQFPQSKALPDVYMMVVDYYTAKGDNAKVAEYGEKAIKIDPQNVSALLAVSRSLTIQRKNLEVAVSYAQKAVDNVEKMKTQPAPGNYSDAEWKQLIKDNEEAAKGQLNYSKAIKQ
jgi:tetratricopeptide (TPR) repeat protein